MLLNTGKFGKLIVRLVSETADKSFAFADLLKVVTELGFELRINGSHHILVKGSIPDIINIQPKGKDAKPYQVKQIRELIIRYKLWEINEEDSDNGEHSA